MSKTGIEIIQDTFSKSVEEVLKVMPNAEKSALNKGATVIKNAAKKNFSALGLKKSSKTKYSDRLIDAIRSSKPNDGQVIVHTMGTRKSSSGTFRTRFFEAGTKERFYKTKSGKKKSVGRIKKFNYFFTTAVAQTQNDVVKKMDEAITKYIEKAWGNGK